MILGCHVSLNGEKQFLGSVEEALSYGANAFMVYTGAPQNTIRRPISSMRIEEALELMKKNHLQENHVVVHAPYIVNLANPDPIKQQFAIDFLSEEVRRTDALHSKVIVLHPGAHMNEGVQSGVERISSGINQILQNTSSSSVIIAIEGMAGKGTEVGRTFEELKGIIDLVEDKSRIGVCLDTCHLNDAGYDVSNDFDKVLEEFDQKVGLTYLKVFHINDSKNELGAHKDRHENIGFGHLGFGSIAKVVHHPLLEGIPKILETPYVDSPNKKDASYPPYRQEIEMLRNNQFNSNLLVDVVSQAENS